jgi:hypothetical protein
MELLMTEEPFSRFARHSRLHRLYRLCGDEDLAQEHLDACQRLAPRDPELALQWLELIANERR